MQTFVNTWCLFHLFELNLFRPLKPNTVKLLDSFCTQGVSLLQIASVPLRNMALVVFSLVFNQLTVPRIPFTSFLVPLKANSVKLLDALLGQVALSLIAHPITQCALCAHPKPKGLCPRGTLQLPCSALYFVSSPMRSFVPRSAMTIDPLKANLVKFLDAFLG